MSVKRTVPLKSDGILPDEDEVTWDMISAGADAYRSFDPEIDEPEALVFAIIYRAFEIAKRNREAQAVRGGANVG